MGGNKQVYREAFERAREGKPRALLQRLLFPFQDHYTQQSRIQGEQDGLLARQQQAGGQQAAPATEALN